MATPTVNIDFATANSGSPERSIITARWQSETGTGVAADFARFPRGRTVQRIGGTGSVALQGSQDGTNWIDLKDPSTALPNTAIALATGTNQASAIVETPRFLRPVVTAGTVTVIIIAYL